MNVFCWVLWRSQRFRQGVGVVVPPGSACHQRLRQQEDGGNQPLRQQKKMLAGPERSEPLNCGMVGVVCMCTVTGTASSHGACHLAAGLRSSRKVLLLLRCTMSAAVVAANLLPCRQCQHAARQLAGAHLVPGQGVLPARAQRAL